MASSSTGVFVRTLGIVNGKKPASVETSTSLLSTSADSNSSAARDTWLGTVFGSTSSISSPPSSRKLPYPRTHVNGHPTRPMSEIHFSSSHSHFTSLVQPTTQRDPQSQRQSLARIFEGVAPPSSARSNPSPLHFRAISMAASLIGTGAITPAKLYAKRTHTLIAKWTLGLLMNSRERSQHANGFPIIREAACPEQEEATRRSSVDSMEPWSQDLELKKDEDEDVIRPLLSPRTLSPRLHGGGGSFSISGGGGTMAPISIGSSLYSSHSTTQPISARSVVEMSDISSPTRSLSPSSSFSGYNGESKPTTDRYGFYTNARPVAVQQGLLKLTEAYTIEELDTPKIQPNGSERDTFDFMKPLESPKSASSPHTELEGYQTSVVVASAGIKPSVSGDGAQCTSMAATVTATARAGGSGTSLTCSITSPVLSTTAPRPTSTLSTPAAPATTVTAILSQLKDLHDSVQLSQKEKWDAFLRKRRRKLHQGELHGNLSSSNLGSPLFSSLSMAFEEEPDDDDRLYWSSQQLIGLATIGKGADWEEFRELVRGGIPVDYRNKIWLEASGAWDMRQPGYYQELLNKIRPEQSACWSDIELDLHRTFPTNILFGYGGQGIDKLRNILTAYALHNPTVGYCQGMNLLAGTLLLTNHSEEDAFWILTCLLGRLLPEDYFTRQLLAPQADQRVLRDLVQEILPRLSSHLEEMHVDLTAITFSWFLTLFTDCLPVDTLVRVWDVLFVEGMLAVFRIAIALLWLNEKEILKCRNGATIYCYMKQMTLGMHQADKLLKTAMVTLKSTIQSDKVEAKRIRYNKLIRDEQIQEEQLLKESAARRRRPKSPGPPSMPPSMISTSKKRSSPTPPSNTTASMDTAASAEALSLKTPTSLDSEPVGSPRATSPPRFIPRARSPCSPQSPPPLRLP
ncbi:hypothetical protein BGW42_002723 [Actinomortierella wolfii]|nr:hypothetical protein BGW42_002723 [Actinomortierella wolfii]